MKLTENIRNRRRKGKTEKIQWRRVVQIPGENTHLDGFIRQQEHRQRRLSQTRQRNQVKYHERTC